MSGDVFGNGMLRSRTIQLIAAFDHRDVFVDPSPDPERVVRGAAAAGRPAPVQLAGLPTGTCSPPGGGIWSRTSKEVPLSPQARDGARHRRRGAQPARADLGHPGRPGRPAVVRRHRDLRQGDQRVPHRRRRPRQRPGPDRRRQGQGAGRRRGRQPRASPSGPASSTPGGAARSTPTSSTTPPGVATSDREVNLKMLLALAIERGRLAPSERDAVLAAVQDDVAADVLRLVGLSAAALARAVLASAAELDAYEALMAALEARGRLDRKVEALPEAEEMATRRAAGAGLIRPELAVLLAYAKSDLTDAIESLPAGPGPGLARRGRGVLPGADHRALRRPRRRPPAVPAAGRHRRVGRDRRPHGDHLGPRDGRRVGHRRWPRWPPPTGRPARSPAPTAGGGSWRTWRRPIDAETEAALHAAVAAMVAALARTYLRRGGIDLGLGGPGGLAGGRRPRGRWPAAVARSGAGRRARAARWVLDVGSLVERGVDRARRRGIRPVAGAGPGRRRGRRQPGARAGRPAESSRPSTRSTRCWGCRPSRPGWPPSSRAAAGSGGRLRSLADDVACAAGEKRSERWRSAGARRPTRRSPEFLEGRGERRARLDRLARQVDGRTGEAWRWPPWRSGPSPTWSGRPIPGRAEPAPRSATFALPATAVRTAGGSTAARAAPPASRQRSDAGARARARPGAGSGTSAPVASHAASMASSRAVALWRSRAATPATRALTRARVPTRLSKGPTPWAATRTSRRPATPAATAGCR